MQTPQNTTLGDEDFPQRAAFGLGLCLVALFSLLYCYAVQDGDYFWHVNTGGWIAAHKSLPEADPFKFSYENLSTSSPEYAKTKMYLKGYWLADLGLYALDSVAGHGGMVAARAVSYLGILLGFFWWLGGRRITAVSLLGLVLLGVMLGQHPNERPQLFTFLFLPLLLWMLLHLEHKSGRELKRWGAGITLLMVAWANMHGGYLLGVFVLGLYFLGRLAGSALQGKRFHLTELAIICLAALSTLLNPNGWGLIGEFAGLSAPANVTNVELLPTLSPFRPGNALFTAYWAYLALAFAVLAVRFKSMSPWMLTVTLGLVAVSLTMRRHMPLPLLASPLVLAHAGGLIPWRKWSLALCAAFMVYGAYLSVKPELFIFGESPTFPKKAASFVASLPSSERIFNLYDWGGYLSGRVANAKVFIDGRNSVDRVLAEHDEILTGPRWERLLAENNVDTLVFPAITLYNGRRYPLSINLEFSPNWTLAYWDEVAAVYLLNSPKHAQAIQMHAKPPGDVYRHIIASADAQEKILGESYYLWASRASAYLAVGDREGALKSFRVLRKMNPANEEIVRMIQELEGGR